MALVVVAILIVLAYYRLSKPIIYLGLALNLAVALVGFRFLVNAAVIPALFIMSVPFGLPFHEFLLSAAYLALPCLPIATFLFFLTRAIHLLHISHRYGGREIA